MSIPDGRLSTTTLSAPLLAPDERDRESLTVDYELGGVALSDPSQGLQVQVWEASLIGNDVVVRAETTGQTATLFNEAGITELSLSFDQNMRPAVAYVAAGVTRLYWFDSSIPAQVTTEIASASSPFLTLDDKRVPATLTGTSDMLLFYVRAGSLHYRQQRDRFLVEYLLAALPSSATRITSAGMAENNRVMVTLGIEAV